MATSPFASSPSPSRGTRAAGTHLTGADGTAVSRAGVVAATGYRVVARALTLALDPSRDEHVATQELRAMAAGDPTVLRMAWIDLVERSFREPSTPVLQAEYLLHQAIMQLLYQPPSWDADADGGHRDGPGSDGHAPVVA